MFLSCKNIFLNFIDGDHGDALINLSLLLPTLNELLCYVDHCTIVVQNIVHQLSALHGDTQDKSKAGLVGVADVHFQVLTISSVPPFKWVKKIIDPVI